MIDNSSSADNAKGRLIAALTVSAIVAGCMLRVLGAWWYRHDMNPDYGIVGLMVKHIVEGQGIPVFFYGQPYMGSLEPLGSALLARAFGLSGFTVCLGTAIVGALLLPVLWRWAAASIGRLGALIAVLFCVVGPPGFFQYMVSPRGGYAVVLAAGAFVLWHAASMAAREASAESVPRHEYLVVGLVGGLAWWSTQLIAPAIATAAALYLVACPKRIVTRRSVWLPVAFLAGSAPFWIWNMLNGWETFHYLSDMGSTSPLSGLSLWAEERLPHMLGTRELPHKLRSGIELLYGILTIAALVETVASLRRTGLRSRRSLTLLSLWIFVAVSCAVSATSFYITLNTSRYLLPLVPVFAVLLAAGTCRLSRHVPFGLGYVPIIIIVAHQLWFVPGHVSRATLNADLQPRIEELHQSLETNVVATVYAPFAQHTLNFHMCESFCFTDMKWERYSPYARMAELDQQPAFLNNYGLISHFLLATDSTCSYGGETHLGTRFACVPPPPARRIPEDAYTEAWSNDSMEIRLASPTVVAGLRLICEAGHRPAELRIDTRESGDADWDPLDIPETVTGFYWSGTRPYWEGRSPRIDRRFEPRRLHSLRLRFLPPDGQPVIARDLAILAPSDKAAPSASAALPDLLYTLERLGIRRVYSDRWLANRIHATAGSKLATFVEAQAVPEGGAGRLPDTIAFTADTALVTGSSDAPICRKHLAEASIRMAETEAPPWTVFHFSDAFPWIPVDGPTTVLDWVGVLPMPR